MFKIQANDLRESLALCSNIHVAYILSQREGNADTIDNK